MSTPAPSWLSTWSISILGRCHVAVLTAASGYLAFMYPAALLSIFALWLSSLISEAMPARWRRWLSAEILMMATIALTWLYLVDGSRAALPGWLRMVVLYWLLIPSRPGLLRWTVSLVLAEACMIGSGRIVSSDLTFGTNWQGSPAVLALPLLGLIPIALAALGLDAWAHARLGARGRPMPQAAWRFIVIPVALISVGMFMAAPLTIPHHYRIQPKIGTDSTATSGIRRPSIAPGEHRWIMRDPTPKARLLWENPDEPLITGAAYLRIFTLPEVVVEGTLVRWEAAPLDQLRQHSGQFNPQLPFAWIVRLPMGSDALLNIDPGLGVDVQNILGDRYGNRYQAILDQAPRAYRANIGDNQVDDSPPDIYLNVPLEIQRLDWNSLIKPEWRALSAVDAAQAVGEYLQDRCRYDLENLPRPAPQAAGILATFLFSDDPNERRGHCQYFATATALMLRMMGHPSRCCSGYVSNEFDHEGYTFRGLNAHAWIDVRDETGLWVRSDPTPASFLTRRPFEGPLPDTDATNETPATDLRSIQQQAALAKDQAPSQNKLWLLSGIGCLTVILIIWRVMRPTGVKGPISPHQAALDKQVATLEKLASELGVAVRPSTTLSAITTQLTSRTGMDLQTYLQAHLAARYGNGPLPPPWPLQELRQAGRRSAAVPAVTKVPSKSKSPQT